jgi:hypothetical protein
VTFKCKKCGSEELVFSCYAKCLIPVMTKEDLSVEYLEPAVDSDDYIQDTGYYSCYDCASPVGNYLQTELDLLEYLSSQTLNQDNI